MNDLIEKLSYLRSQFNCFNENEREVYHTLSEAIKVISERQEPYKDTVSRQKAIDAVSDGIIREEESLVECVEECNAMIEWAVETLKKLPSAQPELCEDTVSRQRLLNDLKELITAWEKYPVMAEQIKGVETAIGYVKTIPSVTPKRKE